MRPNLALKDNAREQQLIKARLLLAAFVVLIMALVILFRFFQLQILDHEAYQTKSQANRVHLQRVAPKRGLIVDREQRILAENKPSYLLAIVRDRVENLEDVLNQLKYLGIIEQEDIERFHKRANRYRKFEPVPVLFNISDKVIAKVASNRIRLPGVEVNANLVRSYPFGELFSHMIGYVGRINEKELKKLDPDNYGATNHIGKIGVEYSYEAELHGSVGYEHVETNARGVVLRTLERIDPIPGENLELFIDLDLQRVAFDALKDRRGAVVAIDPRTGGVLAAASSPSYDPNLFVNGISFEDYDALREDHDLPLFNRVLQGQYPPGSTIKPIVSLAGIEEKVFTEKTQVKDPGWFQLPNDERFYRDWKREGHAEKVGFISAIEESCDVYYYELAYQLGVKNLHKYYDAFGLGEKTGIDVPNEWKGINPSPEWKKSQGRSSWFPGDTLNIGIGQGFLLATPMQLAYATVIIANRGERITPRVVARVGDREIEKTSLPPVQLNEEDHWDSIINGMKAVVHGRKGTAKIISRGLTYKVAGKTGTAQVIGIAQGEKYNAEEIAERQRDHALFVSFAPIEKPMIAVAVIVENGEHGSSTAAPIARKVMDEWIIKQRKLEEAQKAKNNE